jgi:NTE family protein
MTHQHLGGSRSLSLALQGGGSFGAFTSGVLERLLEEPDLRFDMISGASAGAVNAVLLAAGLADGGREAARARLATFWARVGQATPIGLNALPAPMTEFVRWVSPYQINPLGLNPLRKLLAQSVDFARLREHSPVRLLIAATRVRDGQARLFRENEVTLDVLLASACLPFLQPAVEIDGEAYWDGGFSANPPLRQLVVDTDATNVLLVQLLPDHGTHVPHLPHEISRRAREIAFNASLLHEQEAVEDLRRGCEGRLFRSALCRKLDALGMHRIAAPDVVEGLARENPLDTSPLLLQRLHQAGRAATEEWLADAQL